MDEYIKREALMKRFCERCNEEMSESPCEPSDCFAREVIKTIPAADVAPVRHGRWLCVDTDTEQFFLCNRCKKKEYWESGYCPSCGARMDGGAD